MLNFFRSRWGATRPTPISADDSLDAFGSEAVAGGATDGGPAPHPGGRSHGRAAIVVLAVLAALAAGGTYIFIKGPLLRVQAASATLTIESQPPGAEVVAGGVPKGMTPLTLTVSPGEHRFELLYGDVRREVVATARAGASVVHHVAFEPAAAEARTASLRVVTEPERLPVLLNGVARGVSPLTLADVVPGEHVIGVVGTAGTLERAVTVAAGETASVIITAAPAAASGSAAGWLKVESPVSLQILEGRDVIGTSQSARVMLSAGRHELLLTNEALGFSEKRTVTVRPGATAAVKVEMPRAPLSVNAVPWAEVWLDGVKLGETPIGNRQVALGIHEVVFRHPEFGERREQVTVSLVRPARVSVDMRSPR